RAAVRRRLGRGHRRGLDRRLDPRRASPANTKPLRRRLRRRAAGRSVRAAADVCRAPLLDRARALHFREARGAVGAARRGPGQPALREEAAMSNTSDIVVTLPADVQQIDQTGFVWAFLDEAVAPERVVVGALIVAGDSEEPFLARVV